MDINPLLRLKFYVQSKIFTHLQVYTSRENSVEYIRLLTYRLKLPYTLGPFIKYVFSTITVQ